MLFKSLTKKSFVVFSLSLALLCLPNIASLPSSSAQAESAEKSVAEKSYKDHVKDIKKHSDIDVLYSKIQKTQSSLGFTPISKEKMLSDGIETLDSVLSLYPKGIGTTLLMPEINIVNELWVEDLPIEGITQARYPKGSQSANRIYMYLAYPSRGEASNIFHHEMYHAVEFVFPFDEKAWTKLGYDSYYGISSDDYGNTRRGSFILNRRSGFVSDYAYTISYEDRAELYAFIVEPYEIDVFTKSAFSNDRILKQKASVIKDYLHEVFNDISDSKRLLDHFDKRYNQLFARPYFAAKSLAQLDKGIIAYDTHDKGGKAYEYNKGDILYIVDVLKNPQKNYLAVDRNGNLVFIPKSACTLVDVKNLPKLSQSIKDMGISIAYKSSEANISGKSLLQNGEANVNEANLIYANLNNLSNLLRSQNAPAIEAIVLLDGLSVDSKTKSVYKSGKTIYIDVRTASFNEIVKTLSA